jgi:hypothetical protein
MSQRKDKRGLLGNTKGKEKRICIARYIRDNITHVPGLNQLWNPISNHVHIKLITKCISKNGT